MSGRSALDWAQRANQHAVIVALLHQRIRHMEFREDSFVTRLLEATDDDLTAVIMTNGQNSLSYRALRKASHAFAALLRRHGVRKGDAVVVALSPSLEYVTSALGMNLAIR